jgi:hypothetical protein
VRGGPKTLIVALVALLLAVGMAACGGSDSSDSSSTTEAGTQTQTESNPGGEASKQDKSRSSPAGADSKEEHSREASEFVPKQHSDSGGGSAQYKVKGGDNSVQEFGAEADTSELDAAATALHNFLDARAESNWAAACEYMSKGTTESFEKLAAQAKSIDDKSCASILEKLTNPAAKGAMKVEAEKANVRSLRTEGEQAFLLYTGIDGAILAMPMANEDGDWKVASLAGTPLN